MLLCTLTMIPILFLSEVKGNSCRISYERVWSFGSSIRMVVRSRSTRVTPTLSVHFTSAIYVGVWCVWLCIISEGRRLNRMLYLIRTGGLVGDRALLRIFLKSHHSFFILYIVPCPPSPLPLPLHHWCDIVAESESFHTLYQLIADCRLVL